MVQVQTPEKIGYKVENNMFDSSNKREWLRSELEDINKRIDEQRLTMLQLKQNPLDLNQLMDHVAKVSSNTDAMMSTMQHIIKELIQESERNDWASK